MRTIEELEAENAQLVAFVKAVGGIWTDTEKSKLDGDGGLAAAINWDSFVPALEHFKNLGCDEEESDPVERLRFFCSLAFKNPQDWLDSEPFFDALKKDQTHLLGHKSLAEMVSTHIHIWREGLGLMRSIPEGYDASYVDHELKALLDIENACKKEME